MIWKIKPSLDILNQSSKNTMVEHLEIVFSKIGDDFLEATMPVSHKTVQPFRILHGGASVALAETLGSVASNIIVSPDNLQIVGLEINANHLKSAKEGQIVTGRVSPIRIGRKIHVWQIEIRDEQEKLCCTSRLTVAVLN
jgi:1,4-dihydroxy-2-naphthoyl-CoA hydrolase